MTKQNDATRTYLINAFHQIGFGDVNVHFDRMPNEPDFGIRLPYEGLSRYGDNLPFQTTDDFLEWRDPYLGEASIFGAGEEFDLSDLTMDDFPMIRPPGPDTLAPVAAAGAGAGAAATPVAGPLVVASLAVIAWGLLLDAASGGPVSTGTKAAAGLAKGKAKEWWQKLTGKGKKQLPDNGGEDGGGKEPASSDVVAMDRDGDGIPDDRDPNPDRPNLDMLVSSLVGAFDTAYAAESKISIFVNEERNALVCGLAISTPDGEAIVEGHFV